MIFSVTSVYSVVQMLENLLTRKCYWNLIPPFRT
jgi:hypothetical protein